MMYLIDYELVQVRVKLTLTVENDEHITSPYLHCLVLSLSTCGALEVTPSGLLGPGRT